MINLEELGYAIVRDGCTLGVVAGLADRGWKLVDVKAVAWCTGPWASIFMSTRSHIDYPR
jgi:hypothetical protein